MAELDEISQMQRKNSGVHRVHIGVLSEFFPQKCLKTRQTLEKPLFDANLRVQGLDFGVHLKVLTNCLARAVSILCRLANKYVCLA